MAVPLKVNLRSLLVRRAATGLTVGGIALVLFILVLVWSMGAGLTRVFTVAGDPANLLVLRGGSSAETVSGFRKEHFRIVEAMDGIDVGQDGRPLASGELVVLVNQQRRGQPGLSANVLVRGVSPTGLALRPDLKILDGRMFEPGAKELIVSRAMASRFEGCALGEELVMRRTPYRVVGTFEDGGSPYESELWTDLDDLGNTHGREGVSAMLVRAADAAARERLRAAIEADPQLSADVTDQQAYFREQTETAQPIHALASLMTLFLSIGACLSAANTMYASVMSRAREIGTLRALGFSRRSILASYVVEALVVAILAGIVGLGLGAMALLVQGGSSGTSNWNTFSEVAFSFAITPGVVAMAVIVSAVVGAVGGFFPALRAARMPIVEALRAT
jgi:ABC-type antimicrobial peptide transport system permease subunit